MPAGADANAKRRRTQIIAAVSSVLGIWLVWGGSVDASGGPEVVISGGAVADVAEVRRTPEPSEAATAQDTDAQTDEKEAAQGGGDDPPPPPPETPQPPPRLRGSGGKTPFLDPAWGYNKKRNRERWAMLHRELIADGETGRAFSLVDYGSDEGYFSVSAAHAFPRSAIVGVEMGGVGGSIWSKKGTKDVLRITETKIREYGVQPRVIMCQTAVAPRHFFELRKQSVKHDYQLVLSVFHWFTMPDRESFEEVLVAMLQNARTTFIELPIAGDLGPRFMKQVGSKYFVKWYDGRTDIGQVLRDALRAQKVEGTVKRIGGVKWYPADKSKGEKKDWERDVFRVDIPSTSVPAGDGWDCGAHFRLYGCNTTTSPHPVRYSKCPVRE